MCRPVASRRLGVSLGVESGSREKLFAQLHLLRPAKPPGDLRTAANMCRAKQFLRQSTRAGAKPHLD